MGKHTVKEGKERSCKKKRNAKGRQRETQARNEGNEKKTWDKESLEAEKDSRNDFWRLFWHEKPGNATARKCRAEGEGDEARGRAGREGLSLAKHYPVSEIHK